MENRERNDSGRYVTTVTTNGVVEVMREASDPIVTAVEIGEKLGCTSESATRRLRELQEQERVERREVGARAVVWWLAEDGETDE